MESTWTTCRPSRSGQRVWLLSTSIAFILLATFFTFIDLKAGLLLWCVLPIIQGVLWTVLARARFRYNDEQVQCRYFRSIDRSWHDASGWSCYLGAGRLNLYIQFTDGVVVGSNQWFLNRREIIELIPLLMEKIGEPNRGERAIVPWPNGNS